MKLAPCHIQFLLACHVSGNPPKYLGIDYWNSSTGETVRRWLVENNLVDHNYEITDRGRAYIEFICETPMPICKWVRP